MDTSVASPKSASSSIPMSPNTSAAEIQRIFQTQQANRQNVKNTSAKQRKAKLKKMHETVLQWQDKVKDAVYNDFKRAKDETGFVEVLPTMLDIRHAIAHVESWMRPVSVDTPLSFFGTSSKLIYEPKGVTLI